MTPKKYKTFTYVLITTPPKHAEGWKNDMARQALIVIDLSRATDNNSLHGILAQALHFPDWYGRNWDAFWDAITALVELPLTLHLEGWSEFEQRMPKESRMLMHLLEEMSRDMPQLASRITRA